MNKKLNLPYNRQSIDQSDIEAVVSSLKRDYLTTGPEAGEFEKDIAQYVGAKYAVVCANGTAALHLTMLALGISEDDCVLTTPITFVADANAARIVGADVAFVDIEPETANLDLNKVEAILAKRTNIKAIIPVHFAGQPVDIESLSKITSRYGVKIVEDGCHALGSSFTNSHNEKIRVGSCSYSEMTIFSFHPIKSITTGEGGAVTTNDYQLYQRLLSLRTHGITKSKENIKNKKLAFSEINGTQVLNPWYYEMQELSNNYRITDFQCALGRSQLRKLDDFNQRRNDLVDSYKLEINKHLKDLVRPLETKNGIFSANHLFVVRISFDELKGGRAGLMLFLQEHGVQTQVNYMPIYWHPYYEDCLSVIPILPNAENYYEECLSLPLFVGMDEENPRQVVELLSMAFKKLRD
jgi:UDP-4-amino-4,6-dideoxy-N-acetyl-beta-L-altrosamine transaminase